MSETEDTMATEPEDIGVTGAYDRKSDPTQNDDSQPSVTSSQQVLEQASENAGVPASKVGIPAPADGIDLAYRKALADTDADEVGQAVAAASQRGVPAEKIDTQGAGEGGEVVNPRRGQPGSVTTGTAGELTGAESVTSSEDVGTGPYEGRTLEQLRNAARARGLPVSGNKDELAARLRE